MSITAASFLLSMTKAAVKQRVCVVAFALALVDEFV